MSANVLLFNLPIKSQYEKFMEEEIEYNPSLGLLSIASFIRMHGYNTVITDFNYEPYSFDRAVSLVEEQEPLLIGVTVFTENCQEVIRFCRRIKKVCGDIPVIVGGPHATLCPQDLICSRFIDYVSLKEGECTFLELLEHLRYGETAIELSMIDGLMYREGRTPSRKKYCPYIKNLDLLPMINREMTDQRLYRGTVNISTSRGCPANCIYCAATALAGATYRMRDIHNVYMEILMLKEQLGDGFQKAYFIDDTFTVDTGRVEQFLCLMNKHNPGICWACESRVDVMTKELLGQMAGAGCYSIQFGIESGNQEVLDLLKKKIQLEHAWNIIEYSAAFELEVCLSFMFGHYCDTHATMQSTLDFMERATAVNPRTKIGIGYNTPLPGTWQYTHAGEIGLHILTNDFAEYDLMTPIIETENFSRDDLVAVYRKAQKYVTV